VTTGTSLQHTSDGRRELVHYDVGDTMYFGYGEGQFMLHDLANVGDSELVFTTVELKDSSNAPLPLDQGH